MGKGMVGVLVLLVLAMFGAQDAAAATDTWVSMAAESGDVVSGGSPLVFNGPAAVSMSGDASLVQVKTAAPAGDLSGFTLSFAAPNGSVLQDGEYDNAVRWPLQGDAPGIDISGETGCDYEYGRFIVRDIHVNAAGQVDRFWALYEQHCERQYAPALFGEVRIGEPANPSASERVIPAAIAFPGAPVYRALTVPVTVFAGAGGDEISSVALGGADASDFAITSDACTGVTVPAGGDCQVSVAFRPTSQGDKQAELVITDVLGGVTIVPLIFNGQPHVTGLAPSAGPPAGGRPITIRGDEFTGASAVAFGGQAAESFTVDSPTEITAVPPPGAKGTRATVTVTNAHGTSGFDNGTQYTWADPPTAPTDADATPGLQQALVKFSPSTENGGTLVTHYVVRATPGGARVVGTESPIRVTGLADDTTYRFYVRAVNAAGFSPPAISAATTTLKPTSAQIMPSPATSVYGTPVTFQAQITSAYPGTPTGTVQFAEDGSPAGVAHVGSGGVTTDGPTLVPPVGAVISASYGGDSAFAPATMKLTPQIAPADTATSVSSSADPSPSGAAVTITATVSNTQTSVVPFGTVEFKYDGSAAFESVDAGGRARIVLSLPDGTYPIEAQFLSGDGSPEQADFADSSATMTQTVGSGAKTGGSGSGSGGSGSGSGGSGSGAAGGSGAGPQAPSDAFLLGIPRLIGRDTIAVAAFSVAAGRYEVIARSRAGRRTVVDGSGTGFIAGGGRAITLRARLTAAARRLLARGVALHVRLQVSFTTVGGSGASTQFAVLTVRGRRSRRRASG